MSFSPLVDLVDQVLVKPVKRGRPKKYNNYDELLEAKKQYNLRFYEAQKLRIATLEQQLADNEAELSKYKAKMQSVLEVLNFDPSPK